MIDTEARACLLEILAPGDIVYTILRHVSSSGMSRDISLVKIHDGRPFDFTRLAIAMGERSSPRGEGIRVGGVGMDMGFALVYSLSRTLWPDSYACTGKECASNDHTNDYNRLAREYDDAHADAASREARTAYVAARQDWIAAQRDVCYAPDRIHTDGGYALRQVWL